jgi:hypothetical protein
VLAKWLKGVTLAVAAANPASEHCAFLGEKKPTAICGVKSWLNDSILAES